MMRVGFVGLGNIGRPLAANLLSGDRCSLTVHDIDRTRAEPLLGRGARWAASAAEAADGADAIFTSLPTPAVVREVIEGSAGVVDAAQPPKIWVELSTTDPAQLPRIAERLRGLGCTTLDCPVTGGIGKAEEADATFFASGDREAYERVKPLLDCMGSRVFYLGELGNATTCKLITNLLAFVHEAALGEGLMIGKLAGLDLNVVADAINASYGASVISALHIPDIYDGSYDSQFSLGLAVKDFDLVARRAAEVGAPLPVGDFVRRRFAEAAEKYGSSGGDLTNIRLLEDEAGVAIRP